MRIAVSFLTVAALVLVAGCAGPENKFGRGLNNLTEVVRAGEMQRSVEQTALWDGASAGPTVGFARGFTRTIARTGIGIYEVVTFPIPPYGPVAAPKEDQGKLYPDPSVKTRRYPWGGLELSERPAFPASYEPGWTSDSPFATDTSLGFGMGDVAPWFPGSRFSIFGY